MVSSPAILSFKARLKEELAPSTNTLLLPSEGYCILIKKIVVLTALGPMEQKVLEDLFGWLTDPVRDFKKLTIVMNNGFAVATAKVYLYV